VPVVFQTTVIRDYYGLVLLRLALVGRGVLAAAFPGVGVLG
jgi:hypothetical protein